jgi:ABC-type glycerol-3-phosphate transport system substrate-binding protein
MKRASLVATLTAGLLVLAAAQGQSSRQAPVRVLAFWSANVEGDHVEFAREMVEFYRRAAAGRWQFEATTNWDDLNAKRMEGVQAVLWLNDSPHAARQREAFENYMEKGGGWIGFHAAGYNDSSTHWPWFVHFLGGAVFYGNNWPPLPGGRARAPTGM